MLFRKVLIATFVAVLLSVCDGDQLLTLSDGTGTDVVSRFPHHVVIRVNGENKRTCSGSILTRQFVLTSLKCVGSNIDFVLDFLIVTAHKVNQTFSMQLLNPAIHRYPTQFDDIALIQLPSDLIFNKDLRPIRISNSTDSVGKLGILPGYKGAKVKELTYGMYEVVGPEACETTYGKKFDKFMSICAIEWRHFKNLACGTDLGSGLLINWPHNPELIGIFSQPEVCKAPEKVRTVFTDISRYKDWIQIIIDTNKTNSTIVSLNSAGLNA